MTFRDRVFVAALPALIAAHPKLSVRVLVARAFALADQAVITREMDLDGVQNAAGLELRLKPVGRCLMPFVAHSWDQVRRECRRCQAPMPAVQARRRQRQDAQVNFGRLMATDMEAQ